jgi:hypothetical protein
MWNILPSKTPVTFYQNMHCHMAENCSNNEESLDQFHNWNSWRKTLHQELVTIWHTDLLFYPEDGGSTFLWNVDNDVPNYMESHPRRQLTYWQLYWENNSVTLFTCINIVQHRMLLCSRDSSVGTVTGYKLDGLGSIPGSVRFFSSPQRPDRLWAHPASYPMGTGGSFPEG